MAATQALGIAVPKMSFVVNRTTKDLDGTFNGQPLVIPAGYHIEKQQKFKAAKDGGEPEPVIRNGEPVFEDVVVRTLDSRNQPVGVMLPDYAAEMVKRQNVLMGSEDPENPRDVEYLIGCEAWGDNIDHLEQSDAAERLDRSLMSDEAQSATITRNRHSDKLRDKKARRARFSDDRNYNPTGIRGEVGA